MSTNRMTAANVQASQTRSHVIFDLRSPDLLSRWPMIGLSMFIFGSLVFGALTFNLFANGPLLALDRRIAFTLPAIGLKSPPYMKSIMDGGFYLGKDVVIALDAILALFYLYKRYWQELVMVTVGLWGSTLVFVTLSNLIGRVRPPTQIWIVVNIPGFPSGHAIAVVVFYGLLAYLIAPKMPSTFLKWVVVVLALFIILFVGFSRVFTGGHYLTDILAGYAIGIAWDGAVFTAIETYFKRRKITMRKV
jgi:membrane-associated phospholipid phosphatase